MSNKILDIKNLNAFYQNHQILHDVTLNFFSNKATAIMGPSGCGKTTFIRCINRMHELDPKAKVTGEIILHNQNTLDMDSILVRRKIGMVFQRANPFPTMSIYDNVLAGYKLNGIKKSRDEKDEIVQDSLEKAGLWHEVKDFLHRKGTLLSGGQQQRLCIARSLAMKTEILLLDEPTSALDPYATANIEELIEELKKDVTIIIVTHNMSQAARVTDYTAFLYEGKLIEFGETEKLFTVPKHKMTEEYLAGRFG
ncbi:phosphate ABC transporter ATP-binding protein [PVC group bacterium (ex Bugula neritina AB1)]|nr:phosphate ABC transporter ATP-binding protein [PVC group bacterium (ex Bugula neritina AB1)]